MALCSESTGSSVAPDSRGRASTISPAQTRLSLLASASVPPRRERGQGRRAGRPRRRSPPWSSRPGGAAASITASRPGRGLDAGAGQRLAQRRQAGRVGDHGEPRRRSAGPAPPAARRRGRRPAPRTAKRPGGAASSRASVLRADRAGAAEHGDAARRSAAGRRHRHSAAPCRARRPAAPRPAPRPARRPAGPAAPPWPGMSGRSVLDPEVPLDRSFRTGRRPAPARPSMARDQRAPRHGTGAGAMPERRQQPTAMAAASPPAAPDQVLFGRDRPAPASARRTRRPAR